MCITGEVLKEIPSEEEITGTTEKSGLENRLITSFWSVYGLLCCCCFLNPGAGAFCVYTTLVQF